MKYLPLFLLVCLSLFACDMLRPVIQTPNEDPPIVNNPTNGNDPTIEEPQVDPPPNNNYLPGNAIVREWIHRPLHPDNFQSVQFKINALEATGYPLKENGTTENGA